MTNIDRAGHWTALHRGGLSDGLCTGILPENMRTAGLGIPISNDAGQGRNAEHSRCLCGFDRKDRDLFKGDNQAVSGEWRRLLEADVKVYVSNYTR